MNKSAYRLLLPLYLAILLFGCGKSDTDYQPAAQSARAALATVLDGWKASTPPSEEGKPRLQLGDFDQAAGKKLKGYEIAAGEPRQDGSAQAFRVRLELEREGPKEVEYYVVGIDPIWILRDRDYQQASMQ